MAGIGGISCDFVRGTPETLKTRVDLWVAPGLSGYGAHVTGKGDAPFRFRAVRYGTQPDVEAWLGNLEALQGTLVSIVDDWGVTWTSMLITRVRDLRRTAARKFTPIAGFDGARGEVSVEGVKIA